METHSQGRSIASVEEVKASPHPKYEARAAKIDRSKIEVDKDMDLTCFKDRGDEFRTKLLKERKDYKVELVDKDGVAAQKKRLEDLVSGLVELEEDVKVLKEKKTWEAEGEEIAMATMEELKSTLESLLIDEVENDLNVLKADVKKVDKPVVIKEEANEDEKKICDLEEKNKVLSKQVEDLLTQQKQIMETMLGMNNMMIQMNQRLQQSPQQYSVPSWLLSGSLVNPYLQYPYQSTPTIIMMGGQGPGAEGPILGQQTYQQTMQSGQYQLPAQQPSSYQEYDPRYSMPAPVLPGSFGIAPFQYNFGPGPFNQPPLLNA